MLNYETMFEPFTADGCSLDMMIAWAKKKTNASEVIINQAVAEIMNRISEGDKFPLPCPCGCPGTNIHTPINHALIAVISDLLLKTSKSASKVIEDRQKTLLELQLKRLVKSDKQMFEAINGTWSQRNIPTFRRWARLKD